MRTISTTAIALLTVASLSALVPPKPGEGGQQTLDRAKVPVPGPAPQLRVPVWTKSKLANGAEFIVAEKHDLPLVSFSFMGGSDQIEPAAQRGLAGVTAAMMLEGTTTTDATVLDMIEGEVPGGRLIDDLLALVDTTPDPTAHHRAERDGLQREIDTLTRSVAKGMPVTAIAPIVREYQAEIARLDVALSAPDRERVNLTTLREALTQRTAQWRADLRSEPAVARLLLRRLVGPLTLWDASTPGADWCEWEASVTGTELLDGLVHLVASPRGCARVGAPETSVEGTIAA